MSPVCLAIENGLARHHERNQYSGGEKKAKTIKVRANTRRVQRA
jgi:hypothetical protein